MTTLLKEADMQGGMATDKGTATVEIVSDREVGTTMTFVIPMSHHDRTAI